MREHAIRRLAQTDPNNMKVKTSVRAVYRRLWGYVIAHKRTLGAAFLAVISVSLLQFIIPQFTRIAIDDVIPNRQYSALVWIALAIIAVAVLLGFFNFLSSYMMSKVGQRTIYDIRNHMYRHLQELSVRYFETRRTGELMSRVTNDVNTLQQLITSGVVEIVKDLLVFVVIFVYLLYADWLLTLLVAATFPIMIWAAKRFAVRIRGAYKEVQEQAAQVNDHLQETLSAMRLIKTFSKEKHETERFAQHNQRNMEANITAVKYWSTFAPVIELLNYLGLAVIITVGSWRVMEQQLTVGELAAFLVYLRMLQQPVRRFTRIMNVVQQAAAASERIFEVIDTKIEVEEKENAIVLPPISGAVKLDQVEFSYDRKVPVLQGITLQTEEGTSVALVGPSGAGKSTIAHLILRFYDPQRGSIQFDGHDIRDVTLESLRGQIGVVSQDVLLLNGSVRDNIAYSKPDATDEEVIEAARTAHAHEFISAFPEGYATVVGERGVKLSGGQRQRISIARALLHNPKFLILDEATSSLDTESEALIQAGLRRLLQHRTSLVIAHRLSTIQNADRIVVLEQGRIVEEGSHQELIARGGKYSQLYKLQYSES